MHLSFLKKNCATVNYIFLRSYLSHTEFDFSLTILVYSPVRYVVYKWLEKLNLNLKCMFTYSDVVFLNKMLKQHFDFFFK